MGDFEVRTGTGKPTATEDGEDIVLTFPNGDVARIARKGVALGSEWGEQTTITWNSEVIHTSCR